MKKLKSITFIIYIVFLAIVFDLVAAIGYAENITRYFYDGQWHEYTYAPTYISINGENLDTDVPPLIFNDRSVVPARAVFEKLGAKVLWDSENRIVEISMDDTLIILIINEKNAIVNNITYEMEIPPKIINSRTMIPVRFVGEALGMEVGWDPYTRLIIINNPHDDIKDKIFLKEIKYRLNRDRIRIIISTDSEIQDYSILELNDNPRLVIDFDNCIFDAKEKRISVDNNNVFSIRAAQNSLSPDITRVVIDLHEWTEYNIGMSHDKKELYIDIESEKRKITEDEITEDEITEDEITEDEYTLNPDAKDKIVVIDPGHGGKDPGAVFKDEDNTVLLKEADLNLDICLRLYKLLQEKGVKVYMTRSDDSFLDLKDIAEIANNLNAYLFISVHNNAMANNEDYDGTMTLYHPLSDDKTYGITSKDLAEIIQEELIKKLRTTDRGIRERPNLAVLKNTKMPAIIAEVAFITNPSDRAKLMTDDFLQKAADAICAGIIKALNKSISEVKLIDKDIDDALTILFRRRNNDDITYVQGAINSN